MKHEHKDCCNHDHAPKGGHVHSHDHKHREILNEIKFKEVSSAESIKSRFKVSGMDCADEIVAIQSSLRQTGIYAVRANLMDSSVHVTHSKEWAHQKLVAQIERAGVKVEKDDDHSHAQKVPFSRLALVGISGLCCGMGILANTLSFSAFASDLFYILSIFSGGLLVFPKAWRSLRQFALDMNVLMSVAVIGAFATGDHAEAAAVVFLFSLAELLEAISVMRARKAIQEVLNLSPKVSKVKVGAIWVNKKIEDVVAGDVVQVLAGDRVPLDGVIVSGQASFNEAPITGESIPKDKGTDAEVFAGTLCENGAVELRITKTFENTRLAKIIELVEEAQATKAPAQRFVDRFAKIYTPAVMVFAFFVYLIPVLFLGEPSSLWLYRALVLLVIACPCALVISTPIAIVSSLTALAKHGVLVKGGSILESMGKIQAVAFDKTGTITEGKPKVRRVLTWGDHSEQLVLEIAAGIEAQSNHPLAKAVVDFAGQRKIDFTHATHLRVVGGRGVEAQINGHNYFLGNHKFAHDEGVCSPELEKILSDLENEAYSVIIVGHKNHEDCHGRTMGVIALADSLRADVSKSIAELTTSGIKHTVILSGDNQRTVNEIAKQAGVEQAIGDLLPEDKVSEVRKLMTTHSSIAMVGDGINDAPALATATIGIAMGAGTDTAMETADVVLMRNDISVLARAIQHGRRTLAVIRFNISFALITKAIFLVLAIMGLSNMWLAVAADMGASLLVAANSLTLLRIRS